jgi:serine/threonine protein kinase
LASLVPRLTPGNTFAERFRILGFLGQGSMGSVYRAEPLSGGACLALKIVNLGASKDPRALRRFEREAESGTRIDSPYVARTLEAGAAAGGLAWIAMELAEGDTLTELVQSHGALPLTDARGLLEQLFGALGHAHAVGLVHRDLKPDNVRVVRGEPWRTKVLDFGIAKDFGVDTFSGTTPGLGTPLWTAPEQGREGYRPVPNADVWALGLLTFYVLTGRLYWRHAVERASMADLALELLKSELAPASQRALELDADAQLPAGFDAWFARAVVREPSQRFVDATVAWQALAPLLASSTKPAAERPSVVVRPGSFVTLVIVSVVLAGLAIYWLLRSMHI